MERPSCGWLSRARLDRRRWFELCARLGCSACDERFATLEAAYAEQHRRYHTTLHVRECLALLDLVRDWAEHPDEVELAIWLHDVVYVPWRHDNERRSAELATEWLTGCDADESRIERVRALIHSTRHVDPPGSGDERLICDIDLGILGAAPDRFDEYEAQVRMEYRRVPSPVFRSRRRKILASFLERASIYCTPWFIEHREQAARRNLERALTKLRGRTT